MEIFLCAFDFYLSDTGYVETQDHLTHQRTVVRKQPSGAVEVLISLSNGFLFCFVLLLFYLPFPNPSKHLKIDKIKLLLYCVPRSNKEGLLWFVNRMVC